MRTTVIATLGRALGGVFSFEVGESAEALHALALLADEPLDNVYIMAGFCEKHKRRFIGIVPFSSDKAVTLMQVSNALCMLNVHNSAYFSLINQIFECAEEGGEAQNMANKYKNSVFFCRGGYFVTVLRRASHGLFK